MKPILVLLAVICSSLYFNSAAFSQTGKELSELKREIEALKVGQIAIQRDLLEIKNLLLQREIQALREGRPAAPAPTQAPAPAVAPVQITMMNVADAPFKGEKSAKLTLVDFTDYQ